MLGARAAGALRMLGARAAGALRMLGAPQRAAGALHMLGARFPLKWIRGIESMEKDVVERRVHMRRSSFILTIPQAIVRKVGISSGQSVRFEVMGGKIVISPTDVVGGGGAADPDGLDPYKRAITEMMAKGSKPERTVGPGAASGKSKLERLRLK